MASDFTVSEFLAFCRNRPADETYCFTKSSECAVAQFGIETGRPELLGLDCEGLDRLHRGLRDALNPLGYDNTYGALVIRLEALVQETPAKPSPWLNPQTYVDADCGERVL